MEPETENVVISVVMGVYNPEDTKALELAVDSVLNQTFRAFEFLIYDDCSRPDVAAVLRHIVKQDNRIRLLRGAENRGLAHALNECIREAKGRYIARMDADDVSAPERFRRQYEFLELHKEYAFVGLNAELFDAHGVWGFRRMERHPGVNEFLKYSPYVHPSVLFRKNVLEAACGYLETKDTRRCEDYELFMRLYCMGYHGCNIDGKLFAYREDRKWYDKRKLRQRVAEAKIRYRGFKNMGILHPKNMVYVIKPIVLMAVPGAVCRYIRGKRITVAGEGA